MYWCNSNKKNTYKQNDCNVESCVNRCNLYCEFCSIRFYTFNVRLYICFVSLLSLNLYITSCVFEFITVFCTSNVLVNVNLFFFLFWKGIFAKTWTPQNIIFFTKYIILSQFSWRKWKKNKKLTLLSIKSNFLNAAHLIQKGNVGTCCGVFMFLSFKHFMFFFFHLALMLVWNSVRLVLVQKIEKKNSWMGKNARKIKLCLYVKQMLCHTPAVYNVNYLLNKRKCLVNQVSSCLIYCCCELFVEITTCDFSP